MIDTVTQNTIEVLNREEIEVFSIILASLFLSDLYWFKDIGGFLL